MITSWENIAEFFYMGGYALYVWLSVVTVLVVIAAELYTLSKEQQRCHRKIAAFYRSKNHN